MDEQLTYARELQAAGYTLVQIRGILLNRGVDERTVFSVLNGISPTPARSAPPAPVTRSAAAQPVPKPDQKTAYIDYIERLRSHGMAWENIDKILASLRVTAEDRSKLFAEAHAAEEPQAAAAPIEPVSTGGQPQAAPAVQAPSQTPAEKESAAHVETTEEKLVDTADHLGDVVDHLSEVVEKLDKDLRRTEATSAKRAATAATTDDAKRLASATDHLADVVDKLEDDIKRPPPPPSLPNAPAPQIAAVQPVDEPRQSPPPAEAPITATDKSELAKPRAQTVKLSYPVLAGGGAIFSAVFIYSLLSGHRNLTWLGLISMNVVGTAGFDLLLRGSSWRQVDRWLTATILQTGLFLPFLVKEIVRPIHFPHYTSFDILLLMCAVVALITLQFCNVKALQHLEASVFSVVYNARILFATVLGYLFLSESVGPMALFGGLLIFLAIFIVRQQGVKAIARQGLLFGLGAALAMSTMNTCEKELIKLVGYEQYIFPMFTIAAVIMWAVVLIRRVEAPYKLVLQPRGLLLMALRACAGIGFSYSLVFGPVAVSSYLSSLSVVLLVVFGMLFLGERDYLRAKLAATGTAIIGLTLILFDSF